MIFLQNNYHATFIIFMGLAYNACSTPHQNSPVKKPLEVSENTSEKSTEMIPKSDGEKNKSPKSFQPIQTLTKPNTPVVNQFCKKMDSYFAKYNWGSSHCHDYSWHNVRKSVKGNPLVWFTFGDEEKLKQKNINTTLFLCGVHPDEITPVKFCIDLMEDIKKNPELAENQFIIVVPLVNPDSFFLPKPLRTNANGVDVNRNLPTEDWNHQALSIWKNKYRKDQRKFPGHHSNSEPETIFQVNLIKRYNPNKVFSVHAPLTMLDYDGPNLSHKENQDAKHLLEVMSELAKSYKISDYPFFPGSLGNYLGNERMIPTYTLELPNSDWNKTKYYYSLFRDAIHFAIKKEIPYSSSEQKNRIDVTKNKIPYELDLTHPEDSKQ
jgi:protein MpaA